MAAMEKGDKVYFVVHSKIVSGVITDFSNHVLSIRTRNGQIYSRLYRDAVPMVEPRMGLVRVLDHFREAFLNESRPITTIDESPHSVIRNGILFDISNALFRAGTMIADDRSTSEPSDDRPEREPSVDADEYRQGECAYIVHEGKVARGFILAILNGDCCVHVECRDWHKDFWRTQEELREVRDTFDVADKSEKNKADHVYIETFGIALEQSIVSVRKHVPYRKAVNDVDA